MYSVTGFITGLPTLKVLNHITDNQSVVWYVHKILFHAQDASKPNKCLAYHSGGQETSLTLMVAAKEALRFVAMERSSGSRQVIIAMPAVRWRTMCCAAMCMRWMSGSMAKSCVVPCVCVCVCTFGSTNGDTRGFYNYHSLTFGKK